VKLLFDQNLSKRLVTLLASEFPNAAHVRALGKDRDDDIDLWDYAAANGYAVVTKDKDFYHRSVMLGQPPKVIHLIVGNCSVDDTANALLRNAGPIRAFLKHKTKAYLIISQP
jgi:predicted nuclease of predicted toxin-antitoxin system